MFFRHLIACVIVEVAREIVQALLRPLVSVAEGFWMIYGCNFVRPTVVAVACAVTLLVRAFPGCCGVDLSD